MKRKFKNRRGESFIETLAAMFIISLGMLILAGAIVSSARVNKRAANENVQVVPPPPSDTGDTGDTGWFVAVRDPDAGNTNDTEENQLPIALYKAVPEGGGDDGKQVLYYYTAAS